MQPIVKSLLQIITSRRNSKAICSKVSDTSICRHGLNVAFFEFCVDFKIKKEIL